MKRTWFVRPPNWLYPAFPTLTLLIQMRSSELFYSARNRAVKCLNVHASPSKALLKVVACTLKSYSVWHVAGTSSMSSECLALVVEVLLVSYPALNSLHLQSPCRCHRVPCSNLKRTWRVSAYRFHTRWPLLFPFPWHTVSCQVQLQGRIHQPRSLAFLSTSRHQRVQPVLVPTPLSPMLHPYPGCSISLLSPVRCLWDRPLALPTHRLAHHR